MSHQGKHEHQPTRPQPGQHEVPAALAHELWKQAVWLAILQLPAWSYRFRHLADGRWYADYAALRVEYAAFAA